MREDRLEFGGKQDALVILIDVERFDTERVARGDDAVRRQTVLADAQGEVEAFVEREAVGPQYFEKPYVLVPAKKAEKGYVLLRDTLASTGKVGVARVVIRTREYLCAVVPEGDALVLMMLRYPQELVEPDEYKLPTGKASDYRITANGIARRDTNGWQLLPNKSAGAEQNRLFLAVLQGDSSGLQRDFELALNGDAQHWTLTLVPRSLLLKQVFKQINIDGGDLVQRIELLEAQGDSTVLRMLDSTDSQPLSDAEQHDFAQ